MIARAVPLFCGNSIKTALETFCPAPPFFYLYSTCHLRSDQTSVLAVIRDPNHLVKPAVLFCNLCL
jgi:hypothetical protein